MSASVDVAPWRRQSSQTSGDEPNQRCEILPTKTNDVPKPASVPAPPAPAAPPAPPAPPVSSAAPPAPPPPPPAPTAPCVSSTAAPPPPPPPAMNGMNIPSMRLKSEISDRLEPPSKLQSAMNKDKKPFTYAPGGIDFSEIKSPRMQRRIIRNAQEPEDIVLPPTSTAPVNTNSLPPAACVGMMPQIAIPVFPSNNPVLNKKNTVGRPVSPSLNITGRPVSPSPNAAVGRQISPSPNAAPGRPVSPMPPLASGRPVSPMPTPANGRTMSPMHVPVSGRPVSPMPACVTGRPMSPVLPPSNGRPFSPVGRPMSPAFAERPMSPMGRPMSPAVGRPTSPKPCYVGNRPISPIQPPSSMRPMSPAFNASYQRPVSPNPPPPPQRTQQLPKQYSNVPINSTNQVGLQKMIIIPPSESPKNHTNTIYINNEPSKQRLSPQNVFPTLKGTSPPSWLTKHPNQAVQENVVPSWAQRNNEQRARNEEPRQIVQERTARSSPVPIQHNSMPHMSLPNNSIEAHVIPIRTDSSPNQFYHQQNQQQQQQQPNAQWRVNSHQLQNNYDNMPYINVRPQNNKSNTLQPQNYGNNRVPCNATSHVVYTDNDTKPVQSHSFKVLQKITDSEDDSSSNMLYSADGVPLSQLRKLHLHNDDQKFMNRVKAQVDDDTFLHMETDPRYRGAAIPSKAFRILQNMTDAGQVKTNPNAAVVNHNHSQHHNNVTMSSKQPYTNVIYAESRPLMMMQENRDNEANTTAYIPPSERQAEQELRKYMGSSIPSRSFRMLQAMTATQDTAGRDDETDF